jgi:hypothetical protein
MTKSIKFAETMERKMVIIMGGSLYDKPDQRPWTIHRNRRGWPRWYQRWVEAWWVVTGKWSLHRAWQAGKDLGAREEYQRVVVNGGDLGPITRKVVDIAWGVALEDGSVPSSKIGNSIIALAWSNLRDQATQR